MNKIIITIFLFIIVSSCKKDNPEPQVIVTNNSQRLSGISPTPGFTMNNVSFFPNPGAAVDINFQSADTTGNCSISILAGKYSETVYNQKLSSKNHSGLLTVELQSFPKGVALIQVLLGSQIWEYNLIID